MARNTMKKIFCGALAMTSAFASVAMMSACETSHPEVKMTLEFNDEEYELTYKLYRKLTPATATHFLELVDGGYYDGLCVHDYESSNWFTGGYTYDSSKTDDGGLVYKDYYTAAAELELTSTVWKDEARTQSLYTLYGEFSKNKFKVENGTIKNGFGALTMRYTDKGDYAGQTVFCEKSSGGSTMRDYGYNSATSLFSISLSKSGSTFSEYCTFATLDEDSVEVLEDLQAAIADYIAAEFENEDEFVTDVDMEINEDDPFASRDTADYQVPVEPITIKEMKVTKW